MLLFIGIVILLIFLWFRKKFSFWETHGFPYVPGKIPLGSVGEMGFKKHSSDLFKEFYDANKGKAPGFGVYFMTQPVFVPTEPELIKDILVRHFESFHDRGFYFNEVDDPLSKHLFMTSGQEWKDLRAKLSPTFTSGKMKMMFGSVSSVADGMIEHLKTTANAGKSFEMKELLSSFTTEVISSVAFGLETKCIDNPTNEFRVMAQKVFDPPKLDTIKFLFMNAFQDLSRWLGLAFNDKQTTKFFMGMIENTLNHREKNNIHRNDFLQLLIQLKNSENGMTMNEIAANSFVFFLAGFETSSSTATFSLYELALNQDIQDRLRAEIEEVLADHNGEVTYDGIMEMKYLDMVVNETLRKYPVVDTQFRQSSANKDFKIPNSTLSIPKNTSVIISSYALHHDERFYDNPSKFDPERFTEENIKSRHPFAYIPFSEGPRICIGLRFGLMQTKIGLVKLLKNYRFSTCQQTTIPMKFSPSSAFLSPVGGMWLKIDSIN